MYHHVAPDREITPEGFEDQLRRLKDGGWRSIRSAELSDHLSGAVPAPKRSLVITFDDGYADNWVYAWPLLRRYGFCAQIFVVTERVGRGALRLTVEEGGSLLDTRREERGRDGFLRWDELRAMSRSGVFEVGSHTHTHRGFRREARYEDVERELSDSRRAIESELGLWEGLLAWPWGDYEESWLGLLPKAGYRLAYTVKPGANAPGDDPLRTARFKVRHDDPAWLEGRLKLYQNPWLARAYGHFHGFDARIKEYFRS